MNFFKIIVKVIFVGFEIYFFNTEVLNEILKGSTLLNSTTVLDAKLTTKLVIKLPIIAAK